MYIFVYVKTQDPFWKAQTEEEREDEGEAGILHSNTARRYSILIVLTVLITM